MNFFAGFLLFIFAFYVVMRLFGRQIFQFAFKKLFTRLAREAQQQQQRYQRNYETGDFQQPVYADEELKVSVPRNQPKKEVDVDEIVEDVDYEEIRS